MRATKASTPYTVVARLVVTGDRKKASKYATVLQLAARRGIEPGAESVAGFIATEGGIEACLRSFRALPRDGGGAKRGGRPSAFSKAAGRMTGLARINAPDGLQLDALSEDYFIVVGVRDAYLATITALRAWHHIAPDLRSSKATPHRGHAWNKY